MNGATACTSSASKRSSELTFGAINEKNVEQLRRLQTVIFPVRYPDAFYQKAAQSDERLCKLAYFNDILVGAICCRFEEHAHGRTVYIMTLGVLAPYRRLKIGRRLLESVLEYIQTLADVTDIYLHVQTSNDSALAFYRQFGFEIKETIHNYYQRIEPPDCFVLRKTFEH
eukprot:GILI01009502.1.p2 GENE.GILI01009502.1~~GILI01009502.1.p2  ORF type:complete len:170 (+),score=53.35 GILI01009502.1:26-535(+)